MNETMIIVALLTSASLLALAFALRPEAARGPMGRALAFVAICALPVVATSIAFGRHMERAKTTRFCLSCHVMQPYGRSLHVDDKEFVPAGHYQNNRIPRDKACFTCHTSYAMFGDVQSKLRGLRHLAVQYLGTIPDTLRLYQPYENRECLHCHEGARRFASTDGHQEADTTMSAMMSGRLSCMASGCHDVSHAVRELDEVDFWKEGRR
jgi:nitrate/TMAO reductase-like tetraheme cytochrome c subunit